MFDKAKQMGQLMKARSQLKKMEKELELITETVEVSGVVVKVTGNQKVRSVEIDGKERADIVEALNKAFKEVQKKSAKKMMEMGGGLSGMLKGFGG